ncbi:DEAD/DEAH box helicase [Desulfofustis glycolicus]|uniref:Superfamily II DNA or RNA helicase, SNF2 family n=1 Tax=Desulfofustis glycolicus DSM 9705 TaxID=1121409 RepID=A0A1M5WQJ1_9BACT|nr:DEAD/DEAH box helicase [Desulfofustis glycolicus]SHH89761.1 Superfamily II DNA or RNA helicase, SNF2 family [Desulfofustis glycolicus DSM 9705]
MPSNEDILSDFKKLNSFERTLLQILSIVYEPAHSTLLVSCLRKLDIKGPRGNRPTTSSVNNCLTKLETLGFLDDNRQCRLDLVESLSRAAVADGSFQRFATVIRKEAPLSYYYGKWTTRCWRAMRELRVGIYLQDLGLIDQSLHFLYAQCREMLTPHPPAVQVVTCPFERSWFRSLAPSLRFFLLNYILRYAQSRLLRFPDVLAYLEDDAEFSQLDDDERLPFQRLLFDQYLLQGRIDAAVGMLENQPDAFRATGSAGSIAFLKGSYETARPLFNDDLEQLREISDRRDVAFFGIPGLFHVLSLIARQSRSGLEQALEQITIALTRFENSEESETYGILATFLESQLHRSGQTAAIVLPETGSPPSLTVLFTGLAQFWLTAVLEPDVETEARRLFEQAQQHGYHFYSLCLADLLGRLSRQDSAFHQETTASLANKTGITPLVDLVEPEEAWKRSLQALIAISSTAVQEYVDQDTRLTWLLDYQQGDITVRPREQKRTGDGLWSKGRPISLERLFPPTRLPYLTLHDRKICQAIGKDESGDGQAHYFFDRTKLLPALVGHPLLFLGEAPSTPVECVAGEPELLIEEHDEHLHINFSLPISNANIMVIRETPTRFKIVRIDDNHRRIAQITGTDGLIVPIEASEQVLTAIGNISSFMTVHSAIAVDASARQAQDIVLVDADPSIYMHILPFGSGFRLEMFVKPFREGNHYLKPGQGVENVMAEVGGRRLQTRRNLAEEERRAREVEELCPILDLAVDLEHGNDREWHLHGADDCLQALLELQDASDRVIVEWPEGEKLSISHRASFANLNLKIRTNRQNWFGLSGEVQLDQNVVIDLKDMLNRLKDHPSRFVRLSNGQFIALTEEFRKRLDELNTYAGDHQSEDKQEILIHPLAALPLEKLAEQARTAADSSWRDHLLKIRQIQSYVPKLPSTLQAELRDYQLEGYYWLARLARWNVGGCLADDMGLGKTLQSLAIILQRASEGPSLVVAPTSVSTNWLSEVARFTPTLTIKQLAGKNREEVIAGLTKFDLLITTYTLLQQEIDALAKINWQTIVLDEAQAIKNAATKRSQAAMALQGGFKLITTGTPIENHLGELWNLFQFINPGLLGSHKQFNERFAVPIERFNNRESRLRLKKLIRPFILRRIKAEVLEELPPRTEVTLEVTMSSQEQHFYEALRQNALDLLEQATDNQGRHLQILTEIMKLRQACCNARLISKESTLPSAKLEVFSSLIEELIASRHKALVFSQFIGHLDIIREYLDARGISYQYLDGSTSSKHRKERVESFQSGHGDLFLISLKAGGLGLNLTAADYVIHMDPWWNPAIEDQASDRAHRIGQTRPVTIYRLVCKDTIEEKIVKLHQEKRDLADSLLEGTDTSARLSSDELIKLIREH